MARRSRKRGEEPSYEAFWVLEQIEGPHGLETFSVSVAERRLTQRSWGRGAAQVTQWFVDGLPVASGEAARAALLLPPPPGAQPAPRIGPAPDQPPDPAAVRLVQALARAQARRDHAAERARPPRPTDNA